MQIHKYRLLMIMDSYQRKGTDITDKQITATETQNQHCRYFVVNISFNCLCFFICYLLFISHAILAYLCDKYKLDKWYPTDLKTRANINAYLHWHHASVRGVLALHFRYTVLIPDAEKAAEYKKQIPGLMKKLESKFSASRYLATTQFPSIADLSCIHEMNLLTTLGNTICLHSAFIMMMQMLKLNIEIYLFIYYLFFLFSYP